jgi:hypothetical protein
MGSAILPCGSNDFFNDRDRLNHGILLHDIDRNYPNFVVVDSLQFSPYFSMGQILT